MSEHTTGGIFIEKNFLTVIDNTVSLSYHLQIYLLSKIVDCFSLVFLLYILVGRASLYWEIVFQI